MGAVSETGEFVRVDGVDLYSEVQGAGDPVLLLHGGFCSLESLRFQGDALAADHHVFAFERPGHGRSADVDGEYDYAQGLRQTLGYLDAHGLATVDVVGYSDGAILGLLLATAHPARVRALVAISANLDPSGFAHVATDGPVLPPPTTGHDEEPDPERAQYDRLSPDGPAHADVVLAKLFRLWTTQPRIEPADLARITARTLVVSGDRDTVRVDHSLLIAASVPGAQLAVVPGTSHALVRERPELVGLLVREFLGTDDQARERRISQTK